jgi:hypothetical protein
MLGCCGERVEETSLLGRTHGHPSAIRDVLARASHDLPRVGLFEPKDIRDVTVCIVERHSKDERSSLPGRQPLRQCQDPQLQRLASFHSRPRIGAGVDWFRQPGLDVRLSAPAYRLHDIDRQVCRRRRQERRSIANQAAIRRLPAYPDILHEVLGLGCAAQQAVGDAEETRSLAQEHRKAVVRVHAGSPRKQETGPCHEESTTTRRRATMPS